MNLSQIITGDCLQVLRSRLADPDSIDAVVTDPPYGLGFMGKAWDHAVPGVEFWAEMLRVAKPGAHLLAFGGTRTHHRMMCAIEDAGWELRDTIMWVYGSGFPKSHNLPDGRGTALKPAWEPVIMARKPFAGTVAANVQRHGTGALNIDACRVGTTTKTNPSKPRAERHGFASGFVTGTESAVHDHGRWPANLIHDGSEEVLAAFPDAPGQQGRVIGNEPTANGFSGAVKFSGLIGRTASCQPRGDDGSAARFFYCAKASRRDRDEGCDDLPLRASDMLERAFTGFTALPSAGDSEHWSDVLGLPAAAGRDEIEAAYRRLRSQHHPDRGGDAEQFHRITKAYEEATS